jgi:hypothetical protein
VTHHEQRLPAVGDHPWHNKGLPDRWTEHKALTLSTGTVGLADAFELLVDGLLRAVFELTHEQSTQIDKVTTTVRTMSITWSHPVPLVVDDGLG